MIKMTMQAMVSLAHLLGVLMTKFGNNLDLRLESWTGIVSGRVESEDIFLKVTQPSPLNQMPWCSH